MSAPLPELSDEEAPPDHPPIEPASAGTREPNSPEAETNLLSTCLLDPEVIDKCEEAGLRHTDFFDQRCGAVYSCIRALRQNKAPVATATVHEELRSRGKLKAVGGMRFLLEISSATPTQAEAMFHLRTVKDKAALRRLMEIGRRAADANGNAGELLEEARESLGPVPVAAAAPTARRSLLDFVLVKDGDPSILLGNRYLNRGDGAVVVSSAGMGKSAISIQMASELALCEGPFGVHGNGALRSLIVQSEDSDGDVAEVWHSIQHVRKLTTAQMAVVREKVHVVTDRVNRGTRFIAALRRHIAEFKPDLVWINPLQAFIDGDVTDSKDLGAFLREGLNSLNQPASFAFIVIHHTTKPATGKERSERLWHEVMYDMAGGAEIINWARAIISLRPTDTEGDFNLVLAKRGRRAGVTKKVPQGVGFRLEPVTTIPLKHAKGHIEVEGMARGLPLIYWESRTPTEEGTTNKGGRPSKYRIEEMTVAFPKFDAPHMTIAQIHKAVQTISGISISAFKDLVAKAHKDGLLDRVEKPNVGFCFRLV